jgi:hypothetical protein
LVWKCAIWQPCAEQLTGCRNQSESCGYFYYLLSAPSHLGKSYALRLYICYFYKHTYVNAGYNNVPEVFLKIMSMSDMTTLLNKKLWLIHDLEKTPKTLTSFPGVDVMITIFGENIFMIIHNIGPRKPKTGL